MSVWKCHFVSSVSQTRLVIFAYGLEELHFRVLMCHTPIVSAHAWEIFFFTFSRFLTLVLLFLQQTRRGLYRSQPHELICRVDRNQSRKIQPSLHLPVRDQNNTKQRPAGHPVCSSSVWVRTPRTCRCACTNHRTCIMHAFLGMHSKTMCMRYAKNALCICMHLSWYALQEPTACSVQTRLWLCACICLGTHFKNMCMRCMKTGVSIWMRVGGH
jgi:hypothetical protein